MGWASHYIEKLKSGERVEFRPRGNSMTGIIESGQLVLISPLTAEASFSALKVGAVVLCKVNGREYLHLVKAVKGSRYQIGNNRGHINGWTDKVYGVVVEIRA